MAGFATMEKVIGGIKGIGNNWFVQQARISGPKIARAMTQGAGFSGGKPAWGFYGRGVMWGGIGAGLGAGKTAYDGRGSYTRNMLGGAAIGFGGSVGGRMLRQGWGPMREFGAKVGAGAESYVKKAANAERAAGRASARAARAYPSPADSLGL